MDHIFGDFFYVSPTSITYGTIRGFLMAMDSGDKYRVMVKQTIPPPDPYVGANDLFSQIALF